MAIKWCVCVCLWYSSQTDWLMACGDCCVYRQNEDLLSRVQTERDVSQHQYQQLIDQLQQQSRQLQSQVCKCHFLSCLLS